MSAETMWAIGGLATLQVATLWLLIKHMVDCSSTNSRLTAFGSKLGDLVGEVGTPDTGLRGDVKRLTGQVTELVAYGKRDGEDRRDRRRGDL